MPLRKFLQALSRAYPTDPSSPGVVVSWLAEGGVYYAAIHRFKKKYGQGRQIVCSVTAADEDGLLAALEAAWRSVDGKAADGAIAREEHQPQPPVSRRRSAQL